MVRSLVAGRREPLQVELLGRLMQEGFEVDIDRDLDLELLDADACRRAISAARPHVVIDCSGAEDHQLDAQRSSELQAGSENLARAAAQWGARTVFVSSGRVFEGAEPGRRVESDSPAPATEFGSVVVNVERTIARLNPQHTIVRSGELYGRNWTTPFEEIISRASENSQLAVTPKPICPPTYARHLMSCIVSLIREPCYGIVHRAATGDCTELELARSLVMICGIDCRVEPAPSGAGVLAPRPPCLGSRRAELPEIPHWRICLRAWALDRQTADHRAGT